MFLDKNLREIALDAAIQTLSIPGVKVTDIPVEKGQTINVLTYLAEDIYQWLIKGKEKSEEKEEN